MGLRRPSGPSWGALGHPGDTQERTRAKQDLHKSAPRVAKSVQRAPRDAPREGQGRPRPAPEGPKRGPREAQELPRGPQKWIPVVTLFYDRFLTWFYTFFNILCCFLGGPNLENYRFYLGKTMIFRISLFCSWAVFGNLPGPILGRFWYQKSINIDEKND